MRSNISSLSHSTKNANTSSRSEKKFLFNNIKSHSTFQAQSKPQQQQPSVNISDYFHVASLSPKAIMEAKKNNQKADKLRHFIVSSQFFAHQKDMNARSKTEDSTAHENSKDLEKINRLKNLYSPSIHMSPKVTPIRSYRNIKITESLQPVLERVRTMLQKYEDRETLSRKNEVVMQKQIDLLKAKVKIYEEKYFSKSDIKGSKKTPDKPNKQFSFQPKRL